MRPLVWLRDPRHWPWVKASVWGVLLSGTLGGIAFAQSHDAAPTLWMLILGSPLYTIVFRDSYRRRARRNFKGQT